jgi:hypothetical protein
VWWATTHDFALSGQEDQVAVEEEFLLAATPHFSMISCTHLIAMVELN